MTTVINLDRHLQLCAYSQNIHPCCQAVAKDVDCKTSQALKFHIDDCAMGQPHSGGRHVDIKSLRHSLKMFNEPEGGLVAEGQQCSLEKHAKRGRKVAQMRNKTQKREQELQTNHVEAKHELRGNMYTVPPPPRPVQFDGLVVSRGSKNHSTGHCRPCTKKHLPGGCPDGVLCNFCHYEHDDWKLMDAAIHSVIASQKRVEVSMREKQREASARAQSQKISLSDVLNVCEVPDKHVWYEPWYAPLPQDDSDTHAALKELFRTRATNI